jgi:hypothetical protein
MRVAAVDVGTNSVRLLVAASGDPLEQVHREMRVTRLGLGIDRREGVVQDQNGRLADDRPGHGGALALVWNDVEQLVDRLESTSNNVVNRARQDLDFHSAVVNLSDNPVISRCSARSVALRSSRCFAASATPRWCSTASPTTGRCSRRSGTMTPDRPVGPWRTTWG